MLPHSFGNMEKNSDCVGFKDGDIPPNLERWRFSVLFAIVKKIFMQTCYGHIVDSLCCAQQC